MEEHPKNSRIGEDDHLIHDLERIIPGNMIDEPLPKNRTIGVNDREYSEEVVNLYVACKEKHREVDRKEYCGLPQYL